MIHRQGLRASVSRMVNRNAPLCTTASPVRTALRQVTTYIRVPGPAPRLIPHLQSTRDAARQAEEIVCAPGLQDGALVSAEDLGGFRQKRDGFALARCKICDEVASWIHGTCCSGTGALSLWLTCVKVRNGTGLVRIPAFRQKPQAW